MENININNKDYNTAESLQKVAPIYFKSCKNIRDVIKKKDIDKKNYIYARLKDDEWIVTDGLNKKYDKLYWSNSRKGIGKKYLIPLTQIKSYKNPKGYGTYKATNGKIWHNVTNCHLDDVHIDEEYNNDNIVDYDDLYKIRIVNPVIGNKDMEKFIVEMLKTM